VTQFDRFQPLLYTLIIVSVMSASCAREPESPTSVKESVTSSGTYIQPAMSTAGLERCSDVQPPLVTDLEVRQALELDEPPARTPFRDPVFGTCLVRVTDRKADLADGDASAGLKNEYSRVQSFNADGSRILVRGIDGSWYVYDASSLQPLERVPIDIDPRWSATDPAAIYYSSETRLMSYNIVTGEHTTVHDFAAVAPGSLMVWTRYEGSPSADGRTWS